MVEFFRKIFDTSDFPARWNCGNWDPFHGWMHILSDLGVWSAYMMIPVALTYYWWRKRDELAFPRLFWLFGAFIFSCGFTHLIEAVIFYQPIYRLSAVVKLITALVSWATVIAIFRIAPKAMELPGIARINRELQQQLERTREAEAALARSNRDLEDYAGIVSHDLRNPMGSALFMTELLKESMAAGNTEAAGEQVEIILESLRSMEKSVKELHAESRVRKTRGDWTAVPLGEVLASVRRTLAPQLEASGAKLSWGNLPELTANRTMIGHLFTNLIDNAIKYRGSADPVISVSGSETADFLRIIVTDNGRGIPESERERIFESGNRASNSGSESGSGLGLALCRKVMEDCGGTIQVRAGAEGGSEFELRFPKDPALS